MRRWLSAAKGALAFFWKWLRRLILIACLSGLTIAAVTWIFPDPVLRWAAEGWSVAEEPAAADAILVLGGGIAYRPQAAAKLWNEGFAGKIYVFKAHGRFGSRDAAETVEILAEMGVDRDAIHLFSPSVTSTYDEAREAAGLVQAEGFKRVLIPTDLFHTRRAKWIFSKFLNCEVVVTEAPFNYFHADDWWKNESGVIQFPNEIAKTFFYWFHY